MVGDKSISTLAENFYPRCNEWFVENKEKVKSFKQRLEDMSQLEVTDTVIEERNKIEIFFKNYTQIKTSFMTIQRIRMNFILKHIDQEQVPFLDKMAEEEKSMFKIVTGVIKEYNEKTIGVVNEE